VTRADKILSYALVLPATLIILAFDVLPGFYAVFISLFDLRYFDLSRGKWIWFSNYVTMWGDPHFRAALLHSLTFTLSSTTLTFAAGLGLALLFRRLGAWGLGLISLVLIPWTISRAVGSLLWKWIFLENGILSYVLSLFHLPGLTLLSEPGTAMAALVFNAVWRTLGFATIMLYAGLRNIPDEIFKAAQVDGATGGYTLVRVTLPLMKNVILIVLSVLTMSYFNEVEVILILTGGDPFRSTETLSLLLYREAFTQFNTGYANALAVTMYALNLLLVMLYIRILRMRKVYG
jgi:multiple sugar transport system permease protein